ncbi:MULTISPECIES: lysophospholipid acyltransferase family protein [Bacteroides]|uniref:lysophospholipid acyltransferase family protein n=1 Tax=Bacteroides TaxID=816 RepID=UPI0004B93402|nr:lysophospholipid acyltransferase family protein [Bacteroides neonati]MCP3893775.1 acyltransferase [Bacteroides sp.]
MKKALYSFIYYRLLGWKMNVSVPDYDKCVVCAAPHTTNLDLFIGKLFYGAWGRKTSFMMKKEWFFFPLGILFKAVGGIPVNRGRKTSLVDQMVQAFKNSKKFHLAITPEGTRKPNPHWKKGFYYIALKAGVPIVLVGIDYPSKTISATKAVMPSGDIEKDMREIKLYYKNFTGKHPENFNMGDI